jgi:hypothetical protein
MRYSSHRIATPLRTAADALAVRGSYRFNFVACPNARGSNQIALHRVPTTKQTPRDTRATQLIGSNLEGCQEDSAAVSVMMVTSGGQLKRIGGRKTPTPREV